MFLPRAASHLFTQAVKAQRLPSGVKLNDNALTAAHRSLPFGSKVRVTNARNGQSVVVTITDRGPFVAGRVIDVTPAGARALGFSGLGIVTLMNDIRDNSCTQSRHAAAVTSRQVCIAEARNARCVLAEIRWRWTLKVL